MSTFQASLLPAQSSGRRRLHLHHGPIDLIVEAFGSKSERESGFRLAINRFEGLLEELVDELPALRDSRTSQVHGAVANRMLRAISPFKEEFVTPMAAVAGAVADEICAALVAGGKSQKAYVNNGGDIALHLSPGELMNVASGPDLADRIEIRHDHPVRGVATSGWRGRSWSFGIADSVTVLAADAAGADVAATLIANAVDLPGHGAITRRPADQLDPDTDLGPRPVTTGVGILSRGDINEALDRGGRRANDMIRDGLISAASLTLAGDTRICGTILLEKTPEKEPAYG